MKILAFAASMSSQSINARLVRAAAEILREQAPTADIEFIDLNDYEMPIYSTDREHEGGIPQLAHQFFGKIGGSDGLIISYAEHNGLYTAAFKNVFDWASRIDTKVFQGKPKLAMATSPGQGGGGNVLKTAVGSAPFFGADIKATFSLTKFHEAFDQDLMRPSEPKVLAEFETAVSAFVSSLTR